MLMRTKLPYLFLCCFLCCAIKLHAQPGKPVKVSGYVLDSVEFKILPGASVEFYSPSTQKNYATTTDSLGRFMVNTFPAGRYKMSISSVGYVAFTNNEIELHGDSNLVASYLVKEAGSMEGITVTSKRPTFVRSFDKLIVDVGNTSLTASGNVFELLQKLPGIQIQQDGLILLKNKFVEVWIDDRPTNLAGEELRDLLNSLPSSSIEKVELISNPSVKYDASASAIINIRTVKIKKSGFNGSVSVGIAHGKRPRSYDGLNLNYRKGGLNIYGSYNFSYENEINASDSKRNTGNTSFIDIRESLDDKRTNHQLKFGVDYEINKRHTIGMLVNAGFGVTENRIDNNTQIGKIRPVADSVISLLSSAKTNITNPNVNFFYKGKLDSTGTQLIVNLDYWDYSQRQQSGFNSYYYDPAGHPYKSPYTFRNNLPGNNNIKSAKIDFEANRWKGKISAGIKIYNARRDNDFLWEYASGNQWVNDASRTNHFIFTENVYAGYVAFERSYKKFSYQAALRGEETFIRGRSVTLAKKFDQDYFKLFPSVVLNYTLSEKHEVGVAYRKSITRPVYNLFDPFSIFQNEFNYIIGNPNLKPQLINSFELSHSYNQSLFSTLTYSRISNGVTRVYRKDNLSNQLITTYDNLDKLSNIGLDLSYSKMIGKWFFMASGNVSYAVVNTTFNNAPLKNKGAGFYVTLFNNFSLPKSCSIDAFIAYSSAYTGTAFRYRPSSFINLGFHMPVFKSRGTLNFFVSDIFKTTQSGYITRQAGIGLEYQKYYDSRYGSISLNYRFGDKKNKQSSERKTGIETEKNRMKIQ